MPRTERTYYVVFGLYCCSWSLLGPVYPLFLLSRGLDLFQINAVLATYLITSFVFEVPTGALADLIGRKRSFLLSCVVRMSAYTLYAFAHSFTDCIIAEFIDAIGTTLASGALDAWAVDGMHAEGNRYPADRFFARAQMISRALMIGAGLVSGYVGEYSLTVPWLVAASGFAITAAVAATLMHEAPHREGMRAGVQRAFGRTITEGFGAVRAAPVLLLICVVTLVGAFGVMPVYMLWPARIQALTGQGTRLMGWVWAFLNVAAVLGSALIPRLLGRMRRGRMLCVVALWRGGALGVAAVAVGALPAVAGLLLQEVGSAVSEPLMQAWMNEHIAAEQRATVLSVRAMSFTLGGGAGLLCIGLLARRFGIPLAWCACASILACAAIGFIALERVGQAPAAEPTLRPTTAVLDL